MSMSQKDKEFLRNAALVAAAAFIVANPKGAAKLAGGAVLLAGAAIWAIRSVQS